MKRLVCLACVLGVMSLPGLGQTAPLTFEVASVKALPPGTVAKARDVMNPFDTTAVKGGLYHATSPVLGFILFANGITDGSQFKAMNAQLPAWAQTQVYSIEARAEGEPTRDQMREMMQSLLQDRFALKMHSTTKEMPAFVMTLAQAGVTGPGLRPHAADKPCVDRPETTAQMAPAPEGTVYCGMSIRRANGMLHISMVAVTTKVMTGLLGGMGAMLGDMGDRPLVDETGLQGLMDMDVEFMPAMMAMMSPDASGPTVEEAMKSQLGVKLTKATRTVTTYTIDHVEKPSEN